MLIETAFIEQFGRKPEVRAQAPGRVNLMGEHTDYNAGFVLPIAIQFSTSILAALRNDGVINVVSSNMANAVCHFSLNDISYDETQSWGNYVRGVVKYLSDRYAAVGGADIYISGDVPQGVGLSSSASIEIALLKCLTDLYDLNLDGVEAAKIAQKAENEFVGCASGMMDQLISSYGMQGHAMLLDCRTLDRSYIPISEMYEVMVINSNVKRGLVDSEYNLRRKQCEVAARAMGVQSLRDLNLSDLHKHEGSLDDLEYRRARHVISENERVLATCEALRSDDYQRASELFKLSHRSMRDDFEITVPPIDCLVELVKEVVGENGCVRMTGGGFGGCIVALVPKAMTQEMQIYVQRNYVKKTRLNPEFYRCKAEDGAFV